MENNSAACTASAGPSERRNRDMIWIHTNANDGSSAGNSCKHDKSIKNNNNATNDDKSNDDGNDNGNNYLCNNDPPMEQPDDCTDPSNNSNNNKVNDDPSSNSLTQGVGFTALTPFRHTLIPSFSTLAEEDNSTLSSNSLDHARSALFTSPSSSPSATPSSLIAHQHRLSSSSSYPLSHSTFSSSLSEDVAILSKMLLPLTGSGNSTSTTTSTTTGAIATAVSTDNKDQQQDDPETALLCVHKDEEQSPSPSSTLSACTQVSLLSGQRGEQAALDNNRMLLMSMSKTGMAGTMSSHHADQDVQGRTNAKANYCPRIISI
ncbi:MAG: hypothetical protein J3R72DRAFT_15349 [Linnemannia gamsii]|nr:MAG: hypothetical protein J3R72DRAFT_15349 [Linnemannia gamsii]